MPTNFAAVTDQAPPNSGVAAEAVRVFSTCPASLAGNDNYLDRVAEVARWSEAAGCTGILVYTDNSVIDPWLVSQIIIRSTHSLCPLVAVQPVYMHPYYVAKMVATLAYLHHRRVFLNMVAGGFKNDLVALNDPTPHDSRYERLVEYTHIIQALVNRRSPLTFEGKYYRVVNLTLRPEVDPELCPAILMSGSSGAGMAAARELGATAVQYPEPPGKISVGAQSGPSGVRIGVIARSREEDAWDVALARFPEDRKGQLTRQLATKISDSDWHHRLAEIGSSAKERDTYWLHPFDNYQTNCPYLVGSYDSVAAELSRYIKLGFHTYILDIPAAEAEFEHIGTVFQSAVRGASL